MLRNNKHPSAQRISLSPLIGGINVSQPPEQIAENEMQECQNFIFERDSQRLVGRGGLKLVSSFDSKIKGMWYDIDNNCTFVFLENRDCYKVVLADAESQREYLDKVTGNGVPQCCKFQEMLFVASGEHLQYYDYSTQDNYLQSITDSPVCDNLFYRWGRLMVTQSGTDRITYSSVGDASSDMAWVENMNDDSSSKWLDVGEKDGGDIQEVVPLSTDIMIFKSNGKVYQFTGDTELDTWALYNVANFTDLTGNFTANMCAENIGEEVVFLSLRGLKTLSTTQDYGNISATDIGSKFNKLLTRNLYEPCMYHMRRRMTLLIRPTSDKKYFVAYNYGLNAATTLKFAMDVEYVLETKDDVFVACGSNIYKWDDTATTDAGEPIEYKLMPRSIIGTDDLLLKSIDTKFASDHVGTATVSVGDRLKVKMPTNGRRKVKCNHSDDLMVLKVESTSRFEVDHIIVEGVGL
jgi:hypothetical protein